VKRPFSIVAALMTLGAGLSPALGTDNMLSLEIISPQSCYKAGDQICVQLYMRNLTQNATGYQAFLQYNNTVLTFDTGSSCYSKNSPAQPVSANCPETGPFPTHIQQIATAEVSPGQINLDGAAPFFGPGSNGTSADSLLATLCFTVNSAIMASRSRRLPRIRRRFRSIRHRRPLSVPPMSRFRACPKCRRRLRTWRNSSRSPARQSAIHAEWER